MRRLTFVFILLALCYSKARAQQDPGLQDSLIIGSVDLDSGATFCIVPIYIACDESLAYYNAPVKWTAPQGGIYAGQFNQYFFPITAWDDVCDTVIISENYKRQIGFCDLGGETNPPLFTQGARQHVWSIYFIITQGALPQIVTLDTTWDSHTASVALGDYYGRWAITPAVVPGYINIGSSRTPEFNSKPGGGSLSQNHPNPFNSSTAIGFTVEKEQFVSLTVYDLLGRKIRSLVANNLAAGEYNTIWDGRDNSGVDVVSGIYYYRLSASDRSITNKMLLLR